jgi:hypothetical protein
MASRTAGVLFRSLVLVLLALGPCIAVADTAADVPPSLRAAIEKARYRIEPGKGAGASSAYQAANPAQGLSAAFSPSGVQMTSVPGSAKPWRLDMKLKSWGYGTKLRPARPAKLSVSGDRIEYRRSLLTEWYVNGGRGVEQGFTLQRPPVSPRGGELVLRLALSGDLVPLLAGEGGGLLLARAGGERVLRFAGLTAFDATGRSLPSRMELRGRELALLVDDAGAVYPVTVDPLLTRETRLTADDAAEGDDLGMAVAVSGDTAVVGSPSDADAGFRTGSAYVFVRSGGAWSQQQKLTASDAAAFDQFGFSVTVNGDTTVIGCLGKSDAGRDSGAAYVFVRSGSVWTQQQKLTANDASEGDVFGISVAISGDTAVVGAYRDSDGVLGSGSAYVFVRSEGVWSQKQKLRASDPGESHIFGWSVAISGDTIVVGSPFDSGVGDRSGAAYVFVRSEGTWTQRQKLTASDAAAFDEFGYSVAVSGDAAVVGSPFDWDVAPSRPMSGSAYVFIRNGTVWSQQVKLTASDAAAFDQFGWSVAAQGDTVVVGATGHSFARGFSGAAYVFVRSGGVWSEQQKLKASDSALTDTFGWSVAVSGHTAVVGSPVHPFGGEGPGFAYVYEPEITGLSPAKVWVGLKNGDDVGLRLDLLAEVFLDATKVGQGELDNVGSGGSGFNNAILNTIPLSLTGGPVLVGSGDALKIKVSARRTCFGTGHVSGTPRLWHNGQAVDSGATRDAGSRFDATIGGTTSDYFLRSGFALSTTAGSSRTSADAFVNSSAPCPARPFTSFGAWSSTLP